jgi:hypothetical protein
MTSRERFKIGSIRVQGYGPTQQHGQAEVFLVQIVVTFITIASEVASKYATKVRFSCSIVPPKGVKGT